MKQFDVVVNAFGAPLGEEQAHVDAGHALIQAAKRNRYKNYRSRRRWKSLCG